MGRAEIKTPLGSFVGETRRGEHAWRAYYRQITECLGTPPLDGKLSLIPDVLNIDSGRAVPSIHSSRFAVVPQEEIDLDGSGFFPKFTTPHARNPQGTVLVMVKRPVEDHRPRTPVITVEGAAKSRWIYSFTLYQEGWESIDTRTIDWDAEGKIVVRRIQSNIFGSSPEDMWEKVAQAVATHSSRPTSEFDSIPMPFTRPPLIGAGRNRD